MNSFSTDELIKTLGLRPHPEGGCYAEIYRSPGLFAGEGSFPAGRCYSTSIYFLLKYGERSALHRIKADELWHFYLGGPLNLAEITPSGELLLAVIGGDLSAGQKLQYAVKAGNWFGAWPADGSAYSLVGCTVSPGFDFRDFELADKKEMLRLYPQHAGIINKL